MTTEKKVSKVILQEKKVVKIGGVNYEISPPSAAVWIKASEISSEVPVREFDEENILGEIFNNAKDYKAVCRIVAYMILGVDNPNKGLSILRKKSEVEKLAEKLTLAPPSDVKNALSILFTHHEAGFFFANITFLSEIRMTKQTKTTETIASGPQ